MEKSFPKKKLKPENEEMARWKEKTYETKEGICVKRKILESKTFRIRINDYERKIYLAHKNLAKENERNWKANEEKTGSWMWLNRWNDNRSRFSAFMPFAGAFIERIKIK